MLQDTSLFLADTVGSVETINLSSKQALIASAFYGLDASQRHIAATVDPTRKTFQITVLEGINSLVVTLFSPVDTEETATLYQDSPANALVEITVVNKVGAGDVLIQGPSS